MFLRKAALRPVPKYAVVEESSIEAVENGLDEEDDALQERLDAGYRELDRRQPVLAGWLAEQVSHHPPISAFHAQNKNWIFYQNSAPTVRLSPLLIPHSSFLFPLSS